MSAPVREEESRTGTVGGGNGESGGDGETPFEREYKDYATGYASVPGLAYENMGWVTEVEGETPKEIAMMYVIDIMATYNALETSICLFIIDFFI